MSEGVSGAAAGVGLGVGAGVSGAFCGLRPLSRLISPSLSALRAELGADQLRRSFPYLAALGAGCLVGAGGVFLAQRLSRRVAHVQEASLSRELTSLHVTVSDLREAVRELREAQQGQNGKGARRIK